MSSEAVMYEWVGTVPGLGAGSLIVGGVIYGVCRLMGKKMWVVGPKGLGEIVEVNVLEWRLALGWLVAGLLGALSYAVFYELGLAVLGRVRGLVACWELAAMGWRRCCRKTGCITRRRRLMRCW